MLKTSKTIIKEYAAKQSLNDKEVIEVLCEFLDAARPQKFHADDLEYFLENRISSK